MTDAIAHIEELIAAQPDGSPLTPKLQEVVAEITKLREAEATLRAQVDRQSTDLLTARDENEAAHGEIQTLRDELAQLRDIAGAVSDGPSQREIKQGVADAQEDAEAREKHPETAGL